MHLGPSALRGLTGDFTSILWVFVKYGSKVKGHGPQNLLCDPCSKNKLWIYSSD